MRLPRSPRVVASGATLLAHRAARTASTSLAHTASTSLARAAAAAALVASVRRRGPAGAALLAAIGAPATVHAQAASDLAAAKQWFSEALRLEGQAKWAEARARLERVEAVKQTPQVAFHLGLCRAREGALVDATVWLERAKERAGEARAADVAKAADAELAAIRPRLASVELVWPTDAQAPRVVIDGEESRSAVGGGPIPLDPGDHAIVVTFATGPVTRRVALAEGEGARLTFAPPEVPAAAEAPAPRAPPPSPGAPGAPSPPAPSAAPSGPGALPWILAATGAAAAAGGTILMVTSVNDFRSVCPEACPRTREAEARAAHDRAAAPYYTGATLVGAGVVAAGVGAFLFLTAPRARATGPAAWLDVAPGGAGLAGRF